MMHRRISPALVVACLALFVALGGTGYAITQIDRNSVRSIHIVKGQVKRSDIARSAVDSRRVKDGSLLGADFAPGVLQSGPAGPVGPKGDTGATGSPGLSGVEYATATSATDATSPKTVFPECPGEKRVISVGVGSLDTNVAVREAFALSNNAGKVTAVEVDGGPGGAGTWSVTGHVVCANVSP